MFHVEQKGDNNMSISTQNAEAIRKKIEAETPFFLHKKGETTHRWNTWNPNIKAMMAQAITIEIWEECNVTPRADGRVQVTTANRRLEWELERLHWKEPRKCSRGRKTLGVVTSYEIDMELWQAWLAEHTEAGTEAQKEAGAEA